MVSPVDPAKSLAVTRIALKALGLQFDQASVGSSVITLPDDMGFAVTVVHFGGPLTAHLLHIDTDGNSAPFGGQA